MPGHGRRSRRSGRVLSMVALALTVVTGVVVVIRFSPDSSAEQALPRLTVTLSLAPTLPAASLLSPATGSPTPSAPAASPPPGAGPAPSLVRPPAGTTAAPPVFQPVSVEAEAAGNQLTGGASVVACGPCSSGNRVAYLGAGARLVVVAQLNVAGLRTIRITYETDGPRELRVEVGGTAIDVRWVGGTGWEVPNTYTFMTTLPAGTVRLTLYNDASPAPDVDRVQIS